MGLFLYQGHPIAPSRIAAVLEHAQRFFALPAAEKLKIDITQTRHHRGYGAIATEQLDPSKPSDLKETFDMGLHLPADHPEVVAEKPLRGPNRHPSMPGWESLMEQHYVDMQALAQTLLRAMTLALGIERDFFDSRFKEPVSVLRMIHYPPRHTASTEDQQGAGAHTDYGCITLLYQDAAGGLQVRNVQGEWIDAPPIEGTFVVNLGDMMARWSNDRYLSTPHRVISPLGVDRYSMPFFAEPHPDTPIECLPAARMNGIRRNILPPPAPSSCCRASPTPTPIDGNRKPCNEPAGQVLLIVSAGICRMPSLHLMRFQKCTTG